MLYQDFHIPLLLSLLIINIVYSSSDTTTISTHEIKKRLTWKLDSLDLEKQILKRDEKSLSNLEVVTDQLRDSLNVIKRIIQKESFQAPVFSRFAYIRLVPPHTSFDWIVTISGFVPLLIIITFLIMKTGSHSKKTIHPKAIIAPEMHKEPEQPTKTPPTSDHQVLVDESVITQLRERMQHDWVTGHSAQAATPQMPASASVLPPDDVQSSYITPSSPTRSRNKKWNPPTNSHYLILEAAREGLGIVEISRRYHISADQVALILKVAQATTT
jgi:hypothetical protein